MENLKKALKNRLQSARRIAVLGIGSELRGDDAAGILVVKRIEKYRGRLGRQRGIKGFYGGTAPENITGQIKKFKPTHLIIVDSADTAGKAGKISLIEPEQEAVVFFSTHRLPVKILIKYLLTSIDCKIILIGIKPKAIDFCCSVSKEVEKSAEYLADSIRGIFSVESL
ncbi:MAG: hydrogenase maturation peptidase HycI [Candidatus Omnitrophota bacterium]